MIVVPREPKRDAASLDARTQLTVGRSGLDTS